MTCESLGREVLVSNSSIGGLQLALLCWVCGRVGITMGVLFTNLFVIIDSCTSDFRSLDVMMMMVIIIITITIIERVKLFRLSLLRKVRLQAAA